MSQTCPLRKESDILSDMLAKPDDPVLIKIYCKIGWKESIEKFNIIRSYMSAEYILRRKSILERKFENPKWTWKITNSYER